MPGGRSPNWIKMKNRQHRAFDRVSVFIGQSIEDIAMCAGLVRIDENLLHRTAGPYIGADEDETTMEDRSSRRMRTLVT